MCPVTDLPSVHVWNCYEDMFLKFTKNSVVKADRFYMPNKHLKQFSSVCGKQTISGRLMTVGQQSRKYNCASRANQVFRYSRAC